MSSESTELKAGHPPAVKAGGMRVVTKHKLSEKPDSDAFDQKYIDQLPEQPNSISAPNIAPIFAAKGIQDTPKEAVQAVHNKPQPTVQKPHSPSKRHIIQPRKN